MIYSLAQTGESMANRYGSNFRELEFLFVPQSSSRSESMERLLETITPPHCGKATQGFILI
ncbi:MAG: hypothetical protein AB2L21_05235 [Anaerolineaceae bacterium]|jgi:hypothetical protein